MQASCRIFAILLVLVSPCAVRVASGCSASSAEVTYVANKNAPGFYTLTEVNDHIDWVISNDLARYFKDGTSTLSCVDARSDDPVIGTPGGDLAELAMGLYVYHTLTNKVLNYTNVQALFRQFMDKHISSSRPFYFHTDDSRLKQVFTAVGTQLNKTVSILPHRTPQPAALNVWVSELVKSYAQGCGHIRLMIDSPGTYGLSDANIIQWLIRAFYEELWAADSYAKRSKLAFVVKLGSLQGKAIGVVSNKPTPKCTGFSPAIPPNLGGSSLFVYTPSAAAAFRSDVMLPFFASQGATGWNATQFQTGLDGLFNTQLGATLTLLSPANNASLIGINVVGSTNVTENRQYFFPKAACSAVNVTWLLAALSALVVFF
jgi:hypothetical protein